LESAEKINFGKEGESKGVEYLISIGHEIITQNYRNYIGEIDIISSCMETVYFSEVKNWRGSFSNPLEVFTNVKMNKMRKLAEIFLSQRKDFKNSYISFCLLEIKAEVVNFHKNLF
jgi:putative endonuclease